AWHRGCRLADNGYGIPEPVEGPLQVPMSMDWVLMPLVAYDSSGRRLGMGGGFYDRSFAFKIDRSEIAPRLIGVAYACQAMAAAATARLPAESWDVGMNGLLNEHGLIKF
ncbi:MAG: 5-formyltetrahydrofolate cyclo-ligase, partial [Pseudomonadota bacterium]